jgi:hypothetical protein
MQDVETPCLNRLVMLGPHHVRPKQILFTTWLFMLGTVVCSSDFCTLYVLLLKIKKNPKNQKKNLKKKKNPKMQKKKKKANISKNGYLHGLLGLSHSVKNKAKVIEGT